MLAYTLARVALFLVAYGLLWLTGLRSWVLLVVLAALGSGIASMWLLAGPRDAVSGAVTGWLANFDERARGEDDDEVPAGPAPSAERESHGE